VPRQIPAIASPQLLTTDTWVEHLPGDLVTARICVVIHGAGALEEAQRRADLATVDKDLVEILCWSRVIDAIAALEAGDVR
jgi:hypothetical protein